MTSRVPRRAARRMLSMLRAAASFPSIASTAGFLALAAQPGGAASIGINFSSGSGGTAGSVDSGTAGVAAQANWNNLSGASGSAAALVDDAGANSGAAVTWTSNNSWSVTGGSFTSGNDALINGYLDTTNTSVTQVTVSGVPYGEYDVYLYFDGDGTGRSGTYTVAGDSKSPLIDAANWSFGTGTFVEASPGEEGNYAVWTSVTEGTLTITATAAPTGGGFRAPLNAIQIVGTATPGAPVVESSAAQSVTATAATIGGQLVSAGASTPTVTLYWGTADAGATAGWQNAESIGTVATPQAFTRNIAGLSPNTTYFVRAFASNAQGDDWANTTTSFTTQVALPSVTNSAASGVTGVAATLGAAVDQTGGEPPAVTIFYGGSDGGENAAAWSGSVDLGTVEGAADTTVSGLSPSTTYYFRARATNPAGTSWAASSGSFTTAALGLPAVTTLAAENVTGTSAELRGEVTSTGGDEPAVVFYYGRSDGGTSAGLWESATSAGTDSGAFGKTVGGLDPLTVYYFRALATNAAGESWSPASQSFSTPEYVAPPVVINEIHYDEDDKTLRAEFIEIHNTSADPVDLSGWSFTDGVEFTFPAGSTIGAGGFAVVAESPAVVASEFGHAGSFGPWTGRLSNSGEKVTLRDVSGNVIDEVDYGAGFPWPTVGEPPSASIELVNPALDNDLGGSWRSSGNIPGEVVAGVPPAVYVPRAATAWSYRGGSAPPPADGTGKTWTENGYDESSAGGWSTGQAPVGYGDGDDNTVLADMRNSYITSFMRRTFTVSPGEVPASLDLELSYDDGAVVWINGTEVKRTDNVAGGAIPFPPPEGFATNHEVDEESPDGYELFTLAGSGAYLVEGTNTIAVQQINTTLNSSDATADASLATGGSGPGGFSPLDPSPGQANSVLSPDAPPAVRQVEHSQSPDPGNRPATPGAPVQVTAKVTDPGGVAAVTLLYQVVEPGDYIAIDDPRYTTDWTEVAMSDDGSGDDVLGGDSVYTATIPAAAQAHRHLVRYRIRATDPLGNSATVPYADDAQPNFAYFVYGQLPDWTGAARPGVTTPVTYSFDELEPVPVYHLITTREDHERSQYIPDSDQGSYGGSDYRWDGALAYGNDVYDHIRYRARGGVWRYAMGKNMWKFTFHKNHRFQARDGYGNKYDTDWRKLNFSALIQQGNFGQRGEQGLFEYAGFKLHNLMGNPAPHSHFVHFRIVAHADEDGPTSSQFDTDFQGLYLAVEQPDNQMLEEHGLPDGNFYKMEGGTGELNNQGPDQPSDRSDLNAFLEYRDGSKSQAWWEENLVLDDYYAFRAVATAIHDYDIGGNKNYFFYHTPVIPGDPNSDKWRVINWDLDLCWTTTYGGFGTTGPLSNQVLGIPALARDYRNTVREMLDLAFNPEQTGKLLDECARFVHTPGQPSFVDADRAMWDYNPILESGYVNGSKAGHGRYYEATGPRTFAAMLDHVKAYVSSQTGFINSDSQNLAGEASTIPARPTATYTGPAGFPADGISLSSSAFSDPQGAATFSALEWRLGEIYYDGVAGYVDGDPYRYEVTAVWESGELGAGGTDITLPASEVRPGRTYRARVRHRDTTGNWSHWSEPVEFAAAAPDVSFYRDNLAVTEFMYHPSDPDAAEAALGYTGGDFEWIELTNIGAVAVPLDGVRFTKGVDFDFPQGSVLAPGDVTLVVANIEAFLQRYGPLPPLVTVAGSYDPDRLSNGGENVKLSLGAGTAIHEFEYDDSAPWPAEADGAGFSLVLIDPSSRPDHADPANWRISSSPGGSPGGPDTGIALAEWLDSHGIASPDDDSDEDGVSAFLEFAFGGDPTVHSAGLLPDTGMVTLDLGAGPQEFVTITFRRRTAADSLRFAIERSDALAPWVEVDDAELVSSTQGPDGTTVQTWRLAEPVSAHARVFLRLRVES